MLSGVAHPPRSSKRCEATLDISQTGKLVLNVSGELFSAYAERVEVSVGVGSAPTKMRFPNGWLFVASPSEELASYLKLQGKNDLLGKLERNAVAILVSCAAVLVLTIATFTHGIPWLTERVVAYLPESVPRVVEDQVLASLDKQFFEVSTLPLARQEVIRQRFEQHLSRLDIKQDVQLLFRSSELGANAFSLSNGTIIVLDDLVRLTNTDQQLDSILLHELGHVEHQHVMKTIVRSSLISLSVALLTGESSGVIDNLAGLGVFIANNGQSQDAEREADVFASDSMLHIHGTNQPMVEMFELLKSDLGNHTEPPAWLNSHPELGERIESLQQVQ